MCFVGNSRDARSAKPLNQRIQLPQPPRIQHRHRALRSTDTKHVCRIGADRAWRAIRQIDHQQQHAVPALKRPGRQQAPEQWMCLRDHPHVARQHRTQLLQSVAFTPGTGKSHTLIGLGIATHAGNKVRYFTAADLVETLYRGVADNTVGKIIAPSAAPWTCSSETLSMSEQWACKAVGLARCTYRRLPVAATPTDPDADLRAWLRSYSTKHPCHGFRRAWAALRHDEGREINTKKVHRLWREEGLQVRVHSPRKRAGVSSVPPVVADAPKVVWALDFQFDSTIDGKAIKIASMVDEHTRESLLDLVERSITAERLVAELERGVRRGRWTTHGAAHG